MSTYEGIFVMVFDVKEEEASEEFASCFDLDVRG